MHLYNISDMNKLFCPICNCKLISYHEGYYYCDKFIIDGVYFHYWINGTIKNPKKIGARFSVQDKQYIIQIFDKKSFLKEGIKIDNSNNEIEIILNYEVPINSQTPLLISRIFNQKLFI